MLCKLAGFSLIEVLVSLIVVSLTAVNITGLQKRIADQQRDNLTHSLVIPLVTEKREQLLTLSNVQQLVALDNTSETDIQLGNSQFNITWNVHDVSNELNTAIDFKEIEMDVSWINAKGKVEHFIHSELVNLSLLSSSDNTEMTAQLAGIIVSQLTTNEILYFEPNMEYSKGAFVIHNGYLYQATSVHSVGDGYPKIIADPTTGIESAEDGWQSYGRIDNTELINNLQLSTLFSENVN
ncbi:type II secretion system protein [Psychromonas algarum]|uniref:type II secretion system protein n=1 Tax=Psychromonas algarum TaxID=2555643 RepID=UPI0014198183|nr:type II secretion system protein [Psychromonas sp. RZ22]